MNCVSVIITPTFPETTSGGTSGPAGGDLAGTYPNPVLDPTAVHGKPPKVTPDGGDELLIWDISTSTLKRITRTDFLTGISSYTDEDAQDAVGTILVPTSTIAFTYNDVLPSISADIVDGAVTNGKLASDAVTATKIADGAVTDAKLRDSAGVSVIGRALGTAGDPGDIVAGADDNVLRRAGGVVGFGQIATGGITDGAVTFAKIQTIASTRLVGRSTSGSGPVEEITIGANLSLSGGTLSATVSGVGTILAPVFTAPFTVSASTTVYAAPFAVDTNTTEALITFAMPRAGTLRNLLVVVAGTQPASGSLVYTVRKNGTDTGLQVTIPANATTGQFSDTVSTLLVAFGDVISISLANNAANVSINTKSLALVADP